jgi:hypothetical protein
MRWLARAAPMGPDGSARFRDGRALGPPVSVRAFGAPLAPDDGGVGCMPPSRCKQCHQPLVEIDHYGERLIGCIECNRWKWRGSESILLELMPKDLEALRSLRLKRTATG